MGAKRIGEIKAKYAHKSFLGGRDIFLGDLWRLYGDCLSV